MRLIPFVSRTLLQLQVSLIITQKGSTIVRAFTSPTTSAVINKNYEYGQDEDSRSSYISDDILDGLGPVTHPEIPVEIFDGGQAFAMDFESRRQRRLDRLKQHQGEHHSQRLAFQADFLEEKQKQNSNIYDMEIATRTRTHNPQNIKQKNILGDDFLADVNQHNSILSDAPAILLESGAGTGKTTVLAGRVAHLIRSKQVDCGRMIILSFTRRDAEALKEKALRMLYKNDDCEKLKDLGLPSRESLEAGLWCGTIHSFAINILRKYNKNDAPLRIISSKEMKKRIRNCLDRINKSDKRRMGLYSDALIASKQSIGVLINYITRCLELWKEAGVISTPYIHSINFPEIDQSTNDGALAKDDYVELAMRLGVPQSAALLALDISGEYQNMHATMGTADPSDVAQMAYDFLMNNPQERNAIRSKLEQVILDEYQDVSVAQHKLLRLVIRGPDSNEAEQHTPGDISSDKASKQDILMPILLKKPLQGRSRNDETICYHVPKIICAGDSNQSLYGWRGAAPSLTVDGFRKDYPQGLVVHLTNNYRLSKPILNAGNVLIGGQYDDTIADHSFDVSPAAAISAAECVSSQNALGDDYIVPTDIRSQISLGQKLLLKGGVISESSSSVFIQGLWDQREEAKFIAADIRKRSKERCRNLSNVMNKLGMNGDIREQGIYDSTDVAVMVRSSSQIKMIETALKKNGVPCVVSKGNGESQNVISTNIFGGRTRKLLPMKPVKLITMHSSKGDEFDDVYLASWTEGVFPHKSAVSPNRLQEERRIAYVACTRARQRVVLTYSYFKMASYFGPDGKKKDITEPVEPSRFLYDLMAISKKSRGPSDIEWSETYGFKDTVAGKNLPAHYADSYQIPIGYTKVKNPASMHVTRKTSPTPVPTHVTTSTVKDQSTPDKNTIVGMKQIVAEVTTGLNKIFKRKWGACRKYREKFRSILRDYGITRGTALVLTQDGKEALDRTVDVLVKAPASFITTRPLSRCTAEQLGLYLIYLLEEE